jgi:undecaprenyl-diphosphatase
MNQLRHRKYAEYIQDFTALGNPFLLLLATFLTTHSFPAALQAKIWLGMISCFLLNEAICSGIKFLWHKPRPNQQTFVGGFEKIDAGSFPSIHAARISFVYGTLAYLDYQQYQRVEFVVVAALIILVVGYSRTFLQKHFWTDVCAGYCFGSAMAAGFIYTVFW